MEDFVSYAFVAPITCFFTSDLLILTCLLMSLLRMTDNDVLECSMLAHSVWVLRWCIFFFGRFTLIQHVRVTS